MNIIWNENPLKTVVELDATEKLLLREKYKSYYLLEECLYGAYYELTTDFRAEERTDRERIVRAVKDMRINYVLGDETWGGKSFEDYLTEQVDIFVEELAGEHFGDCVYQACSCIKCFAEALMGIDTLAGMHWGAYKIASSFQVEGATLNSAIEALRTYDPGPNLQWREDARRAYEGLVAYREAHFR